MSKNYKVSSKPSRSLRGMDFSNPRAVENVNRFPNACQLCGKNTRKYLCYECKPYANLEQMQEKLLASKGYQKHNNRVIPSDERLKEYPADTYEIVLDDGSKIEIPKYVNSIELQKRQERREKLRKAYVLKQILQARDCLRNDDCKFVPFSDDETKQTCTCFGHEEEG